MKTFKVRVTIDVDVTLDETKFDETFMEEYRRSFTNIQSLSGHAEHLAWLHATGREDLDYYSMPPFIEGYGPANEMGIKARSVDEDTDLLEA